MVQVTLTDGNAYVLSYSGNAMEFCNEVMEGNFVHVGVMPDNRSLFINVVQIVTVCDLPH